MRRTGATGLWLLLAIPAGLAQGGAEEKRVSVYFVGGAGLPEDDAARKAAERQLIAASESACRAWSQSEEAQRAKAAVACEVATFDRYYRHSVQKEIDDSLSALRENLEDNDQTALAAAPEEAALVVKVIGRSRIKFKGSLAPYSCVGLEVSPGGKANAAAFVDLGEGIQPSSYFGPGSRQVAAFHPYTAAEPYWLVDGCGQGLRWKMAANGGEVVLKRLAKNYATRTTTASR
jgi:hypothetical protein